MTRAPWPRNASAAPLTNITVSGDDGDFAAKQHIGAAVDAVQQRVTGAVLVVELALGDRVVDVHRREQQLTGLEHLVESQDTGRGFFGYATKVFGDTGPALAVSLKGLAQGFQNNFVLVRIVFAGGWHHADAFKFDALVDQHRGVATVVKDHVRAKAWILLRAWPQEDLLGGPPVFFQCFVLPGEDRDTVGFFGCAVPNNDGGGGLVLGGEDVARGPADLGAECGERLDQHGGLHGHVQRTGNPSAFQRLRLTVLFAQCHQAWHFVFGKSDLVAAGFMQIDVANCEIEGGAWDGLLIRKSRVNGRRSSHVA